MIDEFLMRKLTNRPPRIELVKLSRFQLNLAHSLINRPKQQQHTHTQTSSAFEPQNFSNYSLFLRVLKLTYLWVTYENANIVQIVVVVDLKALRLLFLLCFALLLNICPGYLSWRTLTVNLNVCPSHFLQQIPTTCNLNPVLLQSSLIPVTNNLLLLL